jgi:hypothetical protein
MQQSLTTPRGRITRALLASVVIAGSVAVWTVVPVTWLYFTGGLVPQGGARFLLVLFGCPLTMALVLLVLSWVESHRLARSPVPEPRALLEGMTVVSAVVALVGLILWWFLIADAPDPSGPLQPI